jgi:hypothetical protein
VATKDGSTKPKTIKEVMDFLSYLTTAIFLMYDVSKTGVVSFL